MNVANPDRLYSARFVLADADTLIPNGAVHTHYGMITAVGRRSDFPERPGCPETNLGEAILAPGLVNAHTHLEYACCGERLRAGPFVPWLAEMIETRRFLEPEKIREGIVEGLRKLARSGVTSVGDVSSMDYSLLYLEQSGLRYICFLEIIALEPSPCEAYCDALAQRLRWLQAGPRGRVGLAPHAPYTVSEPLMTALRRRFHREKNLPFSIHVAESPSERVCLRTKGEKGALATLLRRKNFYDRAAGRDPALLAASPMDFLLAGQGAEGPPDLLVHGNDLSATELGALADAPAPPTLVVCPGTRVFHGVRSRVTERARRAGLPLALGTDSPASNDALNLWADMRSCLKWGWNAQRIFTAATRGGARALGLESAIGALRPGYRADFIGVGLARGEAAGFRRAKDALERWLAKKPAPPVRQVWVNGEMILERPIYTGTTE